MVIEDASESLGTFYNQKANHCHTGIVGDVGCISFNGNKIITTGGEEECLLPIIPLLCRKGKIFDHSSKR